LPKDLARTKAAAGMPGLSRTTLHLRRVLHGRSHCDEAQQVPNSGAEHREINDDEEHQRQAELGGAVRCSPRRPFEGARNHPRLGVRTSVVIHPASMAMIPAGPMNTAHRSNVRE